MASGLHAHYACSLYPYLRVETAHSPHAMIVVSVEVGTGMPWYRSCVRGVGRRQRLPDRSDFFFGFFSQSNRSVSFASDTAVGFCFFFEDFVAEQKMINFCSQFATSIGRAGRGTTGNSDTHMVWLCCQKPTQLHTTHLIAMYRTYSTACILLCNSLCEQFVHACLCCLKKTCSNL